MNKFQSLLKTNYGFRTAVGALFSFLIMCSGYLLISATYLAIDNQITSATPASNYFEYEDVEFVGREGDTMLFASTSIFRASHPVTWNDILRCRNSKEHSFFSAQNTASDNPNIRAEFRRIEWNYNEPFPEGKTCYLESTITMNVRGFSKTQKIVSEPFLIPTEL